MNSLLSQNLSVLRWVILASVVLISVAPASTAYISPGAVTPDASGPRNFTEGVPPRVAAEERKKQPIMPSREEQDLIVKMQLTGPVTKVLLGDSFDIKCGVFSYKPASIYWLKDGKRIPEEGINREEITPDRDLAPTQIISLLHFDCLSANDEAEYTCVGSTVNTTITKTYTVQAVRPANELSAPSCNKPPKVSAPRINVYTTSKLLFVEESCILYCRAQGSNVTINWIANDTKKAGAKLDSRRFVAHDDGSLEIKNIVWEDMGLYTCVAKNEHGSDRQESFVYPFLRNPL